MLIPVSTYEREAVGLFQLEAGATVEGGIVAKIKGGAGVQAGLIVAGPAVGADATADMLGLVDDSSTGTKYNGLGNTGPIGRLLPATGAATHIGFPSTAGSGKVTLWIASGIFITDQFDAGITVATAVGTPLYAGAAGVLQTAQIGTGAIVAHVLKVLDAATALTQSELYAVLPRVQPLPAGTKLLLLKFK